MKVVTNLKILFSKKRFWAGLLLAQFVLFYMFSKSKMMISFFERFFEIQKAVHQIIFSWIPFSFGDCVYGIVLFFALKWFWKKRKTWKLQWKSNGLQILSCLAVFYFFFHLCWGLNYCRQPLFEKLNIQRDYTDADFYAFTTKLIAKTNAIHHQLTTTIWC